MTKKQLLKWIEQERNKVCGDLDKKRDEALAACEKKIIEEIGIDAIAHVLHAEFTKIDAILSKWTAGLEKSIVVPNTWYRATHEKIKPYLDSQDDVKEHLLRFDLQIYEAKEYRNIAKKYNDLKAKVAHEYHTLYVNVQDLKTAALGMEYLESLGFDLTELKEADAKPVSTTLAVPINVDLLFIGGTHENQDN